MLLTNSYFSGAGLFEIGLQQGGLALQQSFELDEKCCNTHKHNFNHAVVQSDITQKLASEEKECDVMVATYPCNKYSPIADIHGARTGDDLFLHFFRHIALKKPEIYVVENVPGMKKFPVVMEAMTKLPDYYVSVFCPVETENWLPQRRKRLILIGSRQHFQWREPEQEKRIKLKDILEENPEVNIVKAIGQRMSGKYRDMPIISDPKKDDIAPTCVAHYSKDLSTRLVKDDRYEYGVRPYSVREYARLQGVPDWFEFTGTAVQNYKMIGNGVPVPIGEWVARELLRYKKHKM